MGETSEIGWTDATWNPWHGCIKISPGCKHCYMYRDKARYGQDPTKVVRSKTKFHDPLKWNDPRMVFTCSWSDFFIKEADEWREAAWNIIRMTPQHTYQILTKRPERIPDYLPADWYRQERWMHVQLGVSVESADYTWRLDELLEVDAAIHFASFEPLLDDLGDLSEWLTDRYRPKLGWAIFGGESGPERREMSIEALEAGVTQCTAASVPVFVKQDSALHAGQQGRIPDELWLKEFPKAKAVTA